MATTFDTELPTYEELTVDEVKLSAVPLRAAAFHLGKYCENINNEFMLCRDELDDPRKCLSEGKAVTSCTLDFFRKLKQHCSDEFKGFYKCVDKSSSMYSSRPCRNTQRVFDKCVFDNLNLERPDYGYFCRVKVHHTDRPKPEEEEMIFEEIPKLTEEYLANKKHAKYGSRFFYY